MQRPILIGLLIISTQLLYAQKDIPRFQVSASKSNILLGEKVTINFQFIFNKKDHPLIDDFAPPPILKESAQDGMMEVLIVNSESPIGYSNNYQYTFTPKFPGLLEIPAIYHAFQDTILRSEWLEVEVLKPSKIEEGDVVFRLEYDSSQIKIGNTIPLSLRIYTKKDLSSIEVTNDLIINGTVLNSSNNNAFPADVRTLNGENYASKSIAKYFFQPLTRL